MARSFNRSLRYRINQTIALTMTTVTVIFGVILAIHEVNRRIGAENQIEQSLRQLTEQYSDQLGNEIFAGQILAIQASMDEIMHKSVLLSIFIFDASGKFLASNDSEKSMGAEKRKMIAPLPDEPVIASDRWAGHSVLRFTSPINAFGEQVGFWEILYPLDQLNQQTIGIIFIFLTLILSVGILIFLMLNSLVLRFVIRPVQRLQDTMRMVLDMDTGYEKNADPVSNNALDKIWSDPASA